MLNKKKKIPTLANIEKLFTYVPKVFIVLLGIILFFINFTILDSKEKKDIDFIEHEIIINYEFVQKNNLYTFIDNIKDNIKNQLVEYEVKVKQSIYQLKGYMKAKYSSYLDINDLFQHLIQIQGKENIRFVVFDKELNIIYGNDTVSNMQKLMFNYSDTKRYKKLLLLYIYSQGKNNFQTWKYDAQKNIMLSFFDTITISNKTLYIGAISSANNIKETINSTVTNTIQMMPTTLDHHIWFYDFKTNKTFNYDGDNKTVFGFKILNQGDKRPKKFEVLKHYTFDETENIKLNSYSYLDLKYDLVFGVDYDKNKILQVNQNQIIQISTNYDYLKYKISIYISLFIFILILFSFIFSKYIKRAFGKYNKQLKQKTKLLEEHKNRMELLVIDEVEKNRKKDSILIQQNKLASMGSMLENIAHQWRQPLNNVNLILHYLRDNYKNKEFTKEKLEKYINKSKLQIDYMSHTIEDFRNFYKPSKKANSFNISKVVKDVLMLSKEQFESNNIKVQLELEDINIINYENELKQTFLNIINNAKDAIVLKRDRKKDNFEAFIKIKVIQNKNFAKITIDNNGGKIKKDIIEKIFDPYFTTRAETLGTGIGLYMAKTIIQTNMKGKIKVENIKSGVKFTITLPLKSILK